MSIITNVSLDHTDLLGDTPQEIAQEKSGINKRGFNRNNWRKQQFN